MIRFLFLALTLLGSRLVAQTDTTIDSTSRTVWDKTFTIHRTVVDTVKPTSDTTTPITGKTFFLSTSENGVLNPPWNGPIFGNVGKVPVVSTDRAKNGTKSVRFEIGPTSGSSWVSSTIMANTPQTSMGGTGFKTGYYSFYAYIDAGFNLPIWNQVLGWMTAVDPPSPISYIGIEDWTNNGQSRGGTNLSIVFYLKNCGAAPKYPCPAISGYAQDGSLYRQTSASPHGVTTFPRNQWVHICVYYKMAPSNGQVVIWQNGIKVMDLTAPTMNTFVGHTTQSNTSGGMRLQHFIYGSPGNETRRMYVDDFKVTDYRTTP